MKSRLCAFLLSLCLPMLCVSPAQAHTYKVTGYQPMTIEIGIEDGVIRAVVVTDHAETPGIGASVIEENLDELTGQAIDDASIDMVTLATLTCNAINEALALAAEDIAEDKIEDAAVPAATPPEAMAATASEPDPTLSPDPDPTQSPQPDPTPAPEAVASALRNGVQFGMDQQAVRDLEGSTPGQQRDTLLTYANKSSAGMECTIGYTFDRGALTSIYIRFTDTHEQTSAYIDDFDRIDASVTAKYGSPALSRYADAGDGFFSHPVVNPADDGECQSLCSLYLLKDCVITHALSVGPEKTFHSLLYQSLATPSAPQPNTEGI